MPNSTGFKTIIDEKIYVIGNPPLFQILLLFMNSLLRRTWDKIRKDGLSLTIHLGAQMLLNKCKYYCFLKFHPEPVMYEGIGLDIGHPIWSNEMKLAIFNDTYEQEEAMLATNHLPSNMDVIELGGGVGFISCIISNRLDQNASFITIEPNPVAIDAIEHHRELNSCDFEVYHGAYDPNNERVSIKIPNFGAWGASVSRTDPIQEVTHADGISLAQLLERYVNSPICLVVDIEGAEVSLIKNEFELIKAHCAFLLLEFHHNKSVYEHKSKEIEYRKEILESSVFKMIDQKKNVIVYENTQL